MPWIVSILFCLLVDVAASAPNCEWALWVESPVGSDQWSVAHSMQSAFETKSDCDRRAEALNDVERAVAKIERSSGEARDLFTCLPCTVDPRP